MRCCADAALPALQGRCGATMRRRHPWRHRGAGHALRPGGNTVSLANDLRLNPAEETDRIAAALRQQLGEELSRRGLVVGMSGGIDSSVCAALAVRAVGPDHVFGLLMPEQDSEGESLRLARGLAEQLGIRYAVEELTAILDAVGCYRRRNAAIRRLIPEFQDTWRFKVVLPGDRLDSDRLN